MKLNLLRKPVRHGGFSRHEGAAWRSHNQILSAGFDANAEVRMGSARLRRASSGVAPELSSSTIFGLSRGRNFVRQVFRRDAENHTPEARAPRHLPMFPRATSEFGFNPDGAFKPQIWANLRCWQTFPNWLRGKNLPGLVSLRASGISGDERRLAVSTSAVGFQPALSPAKVCFSRRVSNGRRAKHNAISPCAC